ATRRVEHVAQPDRRRDGAIPAGRRDRGEARGGPPRRPRVSDAVGQEPAPARVPRPAQAGPLRGGPAVSPPGAGNSPDVPGAAPRRGREERAGELAGPARRGRTVAGPPRAGP